MTYQRFKFPAQTVAKLASVAGAHAQTNFLPAAPRARFPTTLKTKLVSYNQAISTEEVDLPRRDENFVCARAPATLANFATVAELRGELAKFKQARPYGATRFRHDQACWAAEMFLTEWESLAAEFGWTADDVFTPPRGSSSGLAYWLGVEIITALGPEHAVTEGGRVFDRLEPPKQKTNTHHPIKLAP